MALLLERHQQEDYTGRPTRELMSGEKEIPTEIMTIIITTVQTIMEKLPMEDTNKCK